MRPPENWETERLELRALVPADAEGPYSSWVQDAQVTRYLEVRFDPPDPEALRIFIEEMNSSPSNLVVGLVRKDTGMHIGNIRLGPIDRRHQRASVGLMVGDRGSWGQGFASEAIGAVSVFAFKTHGLKKLTAGLYAPNTGSQRAFEKAGYSVEAVRKAHAVLDGARIDVIEMARFPA